MLVEEVEGVMRRYAHRSFWPGFPPAHVQISTSIPLFAKLEPQTEIQFTVNTSFVIAAWFTQQT